MASRVYDADTLVRLKGPIQGGAQEGCPWGHSGGTVGDCGGGWREIHSEPGAARRPKVLYCSCDPIQPPPWLPTYFPLLRFNCEELYTKYVAHRHRHRPIL